MDDRSGTLDLNLRYLRLDSKAISSVPSPTAFKNPSFSYPKEKEGRENK